MDWLQALISGIIQGVTEFLPISSSGHLVIYNTLFGEGDTNLAFTVLLHFATLLSVIIVFRRDIWMLVREFFAALWDILRGKPNFKTPERKFLMMVVIATVPAVLIGVGIKLMNLNHILENIFIVAVMLIVTSIFMFCVDRLNKGKHTEADAPIKTAWLVGLFQAAAILPGLSRSGSTIFSGTLGGFNKEFAIRFAFILSIPTILGAGLVEALSVIRDGNFGLDIFSSAIGFVAAAVCGVFSIKFVKVLVRNNRFYVFGIYCLVLSAVAFLVGFGVIRP